MKIIHIVLVSIFTLSAQATEPVYILTRPGLPQHLTSGGSVRGRLVVTATDLRIAERMLAQGARGMGCNGVIEPRVKQLPNGQYEVKADVTTFRYPIQFIHVQHDWYVIR